MFPVEIWSLIIKSILNSSGKPKDVYQIALVCKTLNSIVVAYLYQNLGPLASRGRSCSFEECLMRYILVEASFIGYRQPIKQSIRQIDFIRLYNNLKKNAIRFGECVNMVIIQKY